MKDDRRMKRRIAQPVIVMGLCSVIWGSQGMRTIAAAPRQLAKSIDTTLCDPPPLGSSGPGDSYSKNPPPGYQIESSSPAVILFQRSSRSYEPAEQIEALHRAIALAPNYPEAYERRANLYQSQQNWPQAIADFDRAYQLSPDNQYLLEAQGLVHGQAQDWDRLIAVYQKLNQTRSASTAHNYTVIARAHGELRQWPQMIAAYTEAIRYVELASSGAISPRGVGLSGNAPEFITQPREDMTKAELYLYRGYAYELQNQLKAAKADYDRALKLAKSEDTWAIENLYRSRCRLKVWMGDRIGGKVDAQIAAQERQIRQSRLMPTLPDETALRKARIPTYEAPPPMNLTPVGDSLPANSTGIPIVSSESFLNRGLANLFGWVYEKHIVDPQSAITNFGQAIQLDAKSASAYYHRGVVRSQLQKYDSAIVDFDQAIAINPQFSLAHAARGEALRQLKRSNEAITSLDQALQLDPTLAAARLSQGLIWLERGDAKQAESAFDDVLEIDPESIEALTERAKIRRSRKDIVGATADDRRVKQVRDRWNLPL
jgi:tetratricopeptide (TPR) repeat protein